MIKNKIVTEAIEYILGYIWDDLTLEKVARHVNTSISHFSRVFKDETGESVYAFIKRIKMEQSAMRLKMERDRTITQIGGDYGYSSSNYCSAFHQYHKLSPSSFRNEIRTDAQENEKIINQINTRIRIENNPEYTIMYERYIGCYDNMKRDWCEFINKHKNDIEKDTIFFERTFDDPTITNENQCIYDICMSTKTPMKYLNSCVLQEGKYVVYPFKGYINEIKQINQYIVGIWFPQSHLEIDTRYSYDRYYVVNSDDYMEFDICIPIR